jgi:predicted RNase H-like nuclease (RuvC/YqgF family)
MTDLSQALRAELDAVILRYEALVRLQQDASAAAHERDAATLRADRDRLQERVSELTQRVSKLETTLEQRDDRIASLLQQVEEETRRARDASMRSEKALAEARGQIAELNARIDLTAEESRVFADAFASEIAFVKACEGDEETSLMNAIREAAGCNLEPAPSAYGALKQARLDVVLTRAVRERGRTAIDRPLTQAERTAMAALAQAAGCELIEPALGARFDTETMDKVATALDPSEEGNVLACSMPGLRLAGTEGALVFPKVKVAAG